MVEFCGDCPCVLPKEDHPHTSYHHCTKYKVRLLHLSYHPNLIRAEMCDKNSGNKEMSATIAQQSKG